MAPQPDLADETQLVRTDPFAFLTAVLFDQGVPAERAWLAPMLLRQRLGHLDPARIAVEESAVRDAIQAEPKLHRLASGNSPRPDGVGLPGYVV